MKCYRTLVGCVLFFYTVVIHSQTPVYLNENRGVEERINDVIRRMTLDEKISVIHAQSKFSSRGVPRLGLPDFWTTDGPHGIRPDVLWDEWEQAGQTNDSCVAFPALTCLAATWNPTIAMLYGKSLGEEALYRGKDMVLGPGVNIYRTPLNGRNFEYLGEDPYLSSQMVAPYIEGLQSNGVAACVKHYALNNNEYKRSYTNIIISDRALHEIYLPAFYSAVTKGHTWGLMGAYNLYNNQHNCHNDFMLNKILKHDWKFDGVVISDWGGCHNTDEAVKNGLDIEFGTGTDGLHTGAKNLYDYYYLANPFKQGIKDGKYTMQQLDEKVRRVLRLFFRTTMNRNRGTGFLCSDSHYAAARKIANEGIVLLKNQRNLLPLKLTPKTKLLVVGENAIKMMTVGGGSSSLKVQREISPLAGIREACRVAGATCEYERGYVGDLGGTYNGVTTGQDLSEKRNTQQLIADAVKKAENADYVIFIGGLNKANHQDSESTDRLDYEIPYNQDKVIKAISKINKNIIFVNISGNAEGINFIDNVPAMIQAWYIGSEAGNAIADILTGKANPSGKLPFTWGKTLNDYGAHATGSYPGVFRSDKKYLDEKYKEDIYVGYRWTDKHNIKPLFAFGHGLSYTTFKLSNLRKSSERMAEGDSITFTINVKNIGKVAGAEVVQLYIHDDKCSIDRPEKELKGFQKVYLKPGQNKDVNITIDKTALGFWDETKDGWNYEKGSFKALVGNASDNITLKTSFKLM